MPGLKERPSGELVCGVDRDNVYCYCCSCPNWFLLSEVMKTLQIPMVYSVLNMQLDFLPLSEPPGVEDKPCSIPLSNYSQALHEEAQSVHTPPQAIPPPPPPPAFVPPTSHWDSSNSKMTWMFKYIARGRQKE